MNETPKNKFGRRILRTLWIWLILFTVIVVAMTVVGFVKDIPRRPPYPLMVLLFGVAGASLCFPFVGLVLFIRWLNCWRNVRRALVGVAVLATLVAIFYTEEDWRGKRAWENCKRELEAKGAVLDWDALIPPPVPDDQNFFTVNTNFYLRFVKLQTAEQGEAWKRVQWLNLSNGFPVLDLAKVQPVVAEIAMVAPADAIKIPGIMASDANVRQQLQDSFRAIVGRAVSGAAGFQFSELQLSNPVPAKITLLADKPMSTGELENLIPQNLFTNIGRLAVMATADPKIFQVKFTTGRITAAADYLAWGDRQFGADLDDVRAALKRPYAMIPGDYSEPYLVPIPNFVIMRALAQTLAQRTQCYLMLGQPDKALRELTLIHDMCRILERPPAGKPITLVEAMINVAISGLYANTIADGFTLHGWREPQLVALQNQLAVINLTPFVVEALTKTEPAAVCRDAEILPIIQFMNGGRAVTGLGKILSWFWPRGWTYQNMVNIAVLEQKPLDGFDLAHDTIAPHILDDGMRSVVKFFDRKSPFTPFILMAAVAIPNFSKAEQTAAHNQTLVNETQIVCALERYHLAHGEYPETLDALAPQFIQTIPHDIIGGQPLHYRRTDDGKFLLYSVGWNETDDGGQEISTQTKGGSTDYTKGDWVWKN